MPSSNQRAYDQQVRKHQQKFKDWIRDRNAEERKRYEAWKQYWRDEGKWWRDLGENFAGNGPPPGPRPKPPPGPPMFMPPR